MMTETLYERIGGHEKLAGLLRHFYADVRQHALIGPIFEKHIRDWPAHLSLIESFWARLTGGPALYTGRMPTKHLSLGLNAAHFQTWLQLWEFNCHAHLDAAAARELVRLAREIAGRLKGILGVTAFNVAPTGTGTHFVIRGSADARCPSS